MGAGFNLPTTLQGPTFFMNPFIICMLQYSISRVAVVPAGRLVLSLLCRTESASTQRVSESHFKAIELKDLSSKL